VGGQGCLGGRGGGTVTKDFAKMASVKSQRSAFNARDSK